MSPLISCKTEYYILTKIYGVLHRGNVWYSYSDMY